MGLDFFLYDGGGTTEELRVKKRDIVILGRLVLRIGLRILPASL